MDQSNEKQKKTEHTFVNPFLMNPDNLTYGFASYKGFDVRIVYISEKLRDEYHIKPADGVELGVILPILQECAGEGCEVNLVDRSGLLALEYPIYVKVKNPMLSNVMDSIWEEIENALSL